MRIDTRLSCCGAEPNQPDLADANFPVEALFFRSDVPPVILVIDRRVRRRRASVTAFGDAAHERSKLFDFDVIADELSDLLEIVPALPAHPGHEHDKHLLTLAKCRRRREAGVGQTPSTFPVR